MAAARIERATGDDLEPVLDMWVALLEEGRAYGLDLLGEANRLAGRQYLATAIADDRVFVARNGGIVGFASVRLADGGFATDRAPGLIENLYVVPARRSEGIGSALLEAAEARLAELDADVVSVEALARNEDAVRFYRERGYDPARIELEKRPEVENDTSTGDGPSP